jgi:hypothetical protein
MAFENPTYRTKLKMHYRMPCTLIFIDRYYASQITRYLLIFCRTIRLRRAICVRESDEENSFLMWFCLNYGQLFCNSTAYRSTGLSAVEVDFAPSPKKKLSDFLVRRKSENRPQFLQVLAKTRRQGAQLHGRRRYHRLIW